MRQTFRAKRAGARTANPKLREQALHRLQLAGGFVTEPLERRLLLSATVRNAIPTHVNAATTPQTLFVPGGDAFALNLPQGGGVVSNYYRFSLKNAAAGQLTTFSTSSSTTFIDTAFALYDSDGNLIQISDTDAPSAGAERLSTALNSRQPYVIGVFAAHNILNVAAPYTFTVDTGPQPLGPTISLDAAGNGQFVADTPPNTFAAPADVNYFPIDLTNAGQSATVMLSPVGPDVQLFGQLYRQDPSTGSWISIASQSGQTVSLTATPISGGDVTDTHYLLAASTSSFNAAPQAYQVNVTAGSLLAPATVDPVGAQNLGFPIPSSPGTAQATTGPATPLLLGSPKLFTVTAAVGGPLSISGKGITFAPLVSVYDATGTNLLAVASLTAPGTATATLNATAGSTYVIRLADDHNNNNGPYIVTASQSYTPAALTAGASLGQQPALPLDPSTGGHFFRISAPVGADILAVSLAPDAASTLAPQIVAVGPTLNAATRTAAAGQPASLAVDLARNPGPIDVYVVGTSGAGTATLSYRAITIPRQIPLGQLPTQNINISTGTFSLSGPAPAVGQIAGAQFFEPAPGAAATLQAQGSGGALPLLLRYVQNGTVLQLDDRAPANSSGLATLSSTLQARQLYAIASMTLNADSGGTITQSVTQSPLAAVGVGMVPDPAPPQTPTSSVLRIRNIVLSSAYERDLWETILPYNMTSTPVVTFAPVHTGQPLSATVTVLDGQNNVIASATSTPGGTLTLNLTTVTASAFGGQKLRFLVEPVAGHAIGDGTYNLLMTVPTSDPTPFLFTEQHFNPPTINPQPGDFPLLTTVGSIPFNGTAQGNFTSSSPYYGGRFGNSGSIAIFSFTLPDLAHPFEVYTQDVSPNVNTTIALYKAHYTNGAIDGYDILGGTSANTDYFPADRSQVDSKIVVNNYHILDTAFTGAYAPGANTLYVVVKNEQATQGQYTIGARTIPTTLVGPGGLDNPLTFGGGLTTVVINPESGSGSVNFVGPNDALEFGTPSRMSSSVATVTVQAPNFNPNTVVADLFDANHNQIFTTSTGGALIFTLVLQGLLPSAGYFLRVRFVDGQGASSVSITVPVTNSALQPIQSDSLASGQGAHVNQTEPYGRTDPDPLGNIADRSLFPGVFGSGTQLKDLFTVNASGPASFSITTQRITNETFALYRIVGTGSVEFPSYVGGLVDYTSSAGDGTLTFNDYLFAGTYYLKLAGTAPPFGPFNIGGSYNLTANVPPYDAADVILDPQSANNDTVARQTPAEGGGYFGSQFYRVVAPPGTQSQSPLSVAFHLPHFDDNPLEPAIFPVVGQIQYAVWKQQTVGFSMVYNLVGTGSMDFDQSNPPADVTVTANDAPQPGDVYFISINRDRTATALLFGPSLLVPQSGNVNLVVTSLQLSPDHGRTRVSATIVNRGFATALGSNATLAFSNYLRAPATPGTQGGPLIIPVAALDGGERFDLATNYDSDWKPDAPGNTATFTANYDNKINESDYTDNKKSLALSSVDPAAPSVSISLSDPTLNAETAAGTWGRYVAGVTGAPVNILVNGADTDSNLYEIAVTGPITNYFIGSDTAVLASHQSVINWDLGFFHPTSPDNPNLLHYTAIDAFGLTSGDHIQKVDVVPKAGFFTSVTWDPVNKVYNLAFNHDVVDLEGTINDLVHKIVDINVPVVGDKNNVFKINLHANGTAGLDPTKSVSFPLFADLLIKALDTTIWNPSIGGTQQLTDHLTLRSSVEVNGQTLDATAAAFSLQLQDLSLLHLQTPVLKLFSFGIPDVLSLDAGIGFGLDANLSAGVKIGINPQFLVDPLHAPLRAGLMSPTFVEPSISGSATVEGDVDVLSFDAAALKGTVTVGLDLTFGLDNNDTSKVIPFDDVINHLGLKIGLTVGVHLEADVILLGDVWDYDYSHTFTASLTNQGIITKDPADGGGANANAALGQLNTALSNPASLLHQATLDGAPPVVRKGTDPLGPYRIDPTPQLIIDPATGDGISVQVKNVSGDPNVTTGNLTYSIRSNNQWSALAPLPGGDVGNPQLAFSHDRNNLNPAVVVYEADNGAADPATQTINQRLDDLEIRYRYYDGEGNWSDEQAITGDSLNDSSPSLSFNAAGAGVVAWVHNTSGTPMDDTGNYSRDTQDIQAALWDPSTHTFSAPFDITAGDGVADAKPATFVDADGNPYVVWVRDLPGGGNAIMYSIFDGQQWSQPAVLPITGVAPGGNFGNVAVGADQLGRINVLFSYRIQNADGSIDSRLYDRFSTKDAFGSPAGVEQISQDKNFSHLRTTNAADGSLVAYWQQSDGVANGVFTSILSRNAANPSRPWSVPTRLTSTTDLTQTPSVAVDPSGNLDVLYADSIPNGAAAASVVSDVPVGVPMAPGVGSSSVAVLPELTFSNGLFFPFQDSAAVGSTTTGQATILNRGPAPATVTVNWYAGTPDNGTLLGTNQVMIGAGNSYLFSQSFPVRAGSQTYSVQVSSATGEAISTNDDISTATLGGLPDITIKSISASPATPAAGQNVTLNVDVKNLGNAAVGPFDVTLYAGDPRFPQNPVTAIATQTVQTLAANGDTVLPFNITLPTASGDYVYTAVADSGNAIAEAVEGNNDAQYRISFRADPTLGPDVSHFLLGASATLQDLSGVNNVKVSIGVGNLGTASISNLPIDLQVSRNEGPFVGAGQMIIPSLNPGQTTSLTFFANGLEGTNVYRVVVDPSVLAQDSNLQNDASEATLVIHGLPDLAVPTVTVSNPTPPQGSTFIVNATIANLGIADASNVLVEVFATPDGGDPILVATTSTDVAALTQTQLTIPVHTGALQQGHYVLTVQVNRLHGVLETTEANDTGTSEVTIGAPVVIPTSNIVNGVVGLANTITLRRDPDDPTKDDVWINVAETELPTQLALIGQPIIVNGGGTVDTLVLDPANGDPLPVQLVLNGSFTTGTLTINASELVTLGHTAAANANRLSVGGLTIDPAGALDLGDGSLSVSYSGAAPLAQIQAYLHEGFASGAWDGQGITSGDAQSHRGFAIGYADSADGLIPGQPTNTVLLRYTRIGDTNLDGTTNFADLLALAQHYSRPTGKWSDGDSNYDGTVNFADLLGLAQNYGQPAAVAAAASAVPSDDTLASVLTRLRRPVARHK